jgi:hypothetical protein
MDFSQVWTCLDMFEVFFGNSSVVSCTSSIWTQSDENDYWCIGPLRVREVRPEFCYKVTTQCEPMDDHRVHLDTPESRQETTN